MEDQGGGAAARRQAAVAALVVTGVVLACVLVAWAAVVRPSTVLDGPGPARMHDPVTTTPTTSTTADAQDRTDPAATTTPGDTPFLLRLLGIVLPMAVLLLMAAAVVAAAYYFWSQRNRPIVLPGDQVDFDTVDAPARAAAALVDGADVQRSQLESGEPRNAIVACWDHFEDAAGRVGLGRRRWETSSEFTVRLLRDLDADTGAVGRLAALYREARFSEHPLGEEARSRALAALEDIHASLRQTVRGR